MADRETVTQLGRLLGAVARDHHEATGGVNPEWARWYGEHLEGEIDRFLGHSPSAGEIAGWLTEADRRYNEEGPDMPWPYYYAGLILDTLAVKPT